MINANRRTILGAGALLTLASIKANAHPHSNQSIENDLNRYVGFGIKRAGGRGDTACGKWMVGELKKSGYDIHRQTFNVPYFKQKTSQLTCNGVKTSIYAQPIVIPTGPKGISAPLVRVDSNGRANGSLEGAIALIELPHSRWSSMMQKQARTPVEKAFLAGAKAAVIITNGPTGKVIALNTDGSKPMFKGPVALLAPEDADPFMAAALTNEMANLIIDGKVGTRPAFNFVGKLDRNKKQWIAISTPRSGWFTCAAERGPGVAAWLDIARWAVQNLPNHNLAFICNTGHEYENLGASEAMKEIAPAPSKTTFWLHIGANVAATDWHALLGYLSPLPSVDSQRYLSISPQLIPLAKKLFKGQLGYENPVSSKVLSAGELNEVIKAGYEPAAGVFGIHRYHHVAEDDQRCLNVKATIEATHGFRDLLTLVAQ